MDITQINGLEIGMRIVTFILVLIEPSSGTDLIFIFQDVLVVIAIRAGDIFAKDIFDF